MKRRRFLLASTAALSASAFLADSGAFSSTEIERSVNIDVVDDEDALISLESGGDITVDGDYDSRVTSEEKIITVRNQLRDDVALEVDAWVNSSTGSFDVEINDDFDNYISNGEATDIEADITCPKNDAEETITVSIRVSGGGLSAYLQGSESHKLERSVTISCQVPEPEEEDEDENEGEDSADEVEEGDSSGEQDDGASE